MRARVTKLREETGWGATSIGKRLVAQRLPGHQYATLGRVLGIVNTQARNTVNKELYESIVSVLESIDEADQDRFGPARCHKRVALDDEFRTQLSMAMAQHHHLNGDKALRLMGAPPDLKAHAVSKVIRGEIASLKRHHYDFLKTQIDQLRTSEIS